MARGSEPFQRTPGGAWYIVVPNTPDPVTGRRRQKWLRARTKKGVEALAADWLAKLAQGQLVDESRQPLRDYLDEWLASKAQITEATRRNYRTYIDLYIAPTLGSVPLADLTPAMVQRLYNQLSERLKPASVAMAHVVLHGALQQAVRWGMLSRNVTELTERPRIRKPQTHVWTEDAATYFLRATEDDPYHILWHLALRTGMRKGELLGLRWQDVDLDDRVVRVRGQVKSDAGVREVPLRRAVADELREHRRRQAERRLALGPAWQDNGLVLERGDGTPLYRAQPNYLFNRAQMRVGMDPRLRFHDLRHTAGSLMLAAGMSLFEVSRILGHATIAMTADRYGHISTEQLRRALDRLDEAM